MMNKQKKYKPNLLSYSVIAAAAGGNIDAINKVLKNYEGYISTLSIRYLFDKNGNLILCIDEGMQRRLQTKLITKILSFKTA